METMNGTERELVCFVCEQVVHGDDEDGAFVDASGACGCGESEHLVVIQNGHSMTQRELREGATK